MMQGHYDVLMRTTINLPEDLHRIALAIARDTGRSFSQTVTELLRRGLAAPVCVDEPDRPAYVLNESTGLPCVRSQRVITAQDVRSLEDEA